MSSSSTASAAATATATRPRWDISRHFPPSATGVLVQVYSPVTPIPPLPPRLPPTTTLPPVIYHVLSPHGVPAATTPLAFLREHTALPAPLLADLAALGAIYARVGLPGPRTSPRAARLTAADAARPLLPPATRLYLRVYASPKRHRARAPLRLLARPAHLLAGSLLAVRKPRGLPVAPTADNARDNVLAAARAMLPAHPRVWPTTRLDVGTAGVLLLALSAPAARAANHMLAAARKRYAVWTRARPAPGPLVHWYHKPSRRVRPAAADRPVADGWVRAELVVDTVDPVPGGWRSTVTLVTGRTHQIRVQFADRGWPVDGDSLYGAPQPEGGRRVDSDCLGLVAESVEGVLEGERVVFEVKGEVWEWVD